MNKPGVEIKIGIIGLDSSHSVQYATLLHDEAHPHHVPGGRIVAAYAGGSDDWELSYSRMPGFREQMRNEFSVPILDSIDAVVAVSDAIMILSVDGRVHRAQFDQIAAAGKPVYIDKPFACTLADVDPMIALTRSSGTRVFSSSVWRFGTGLPEARRASGGAGQHAVLSGMWPLHPGLHGWAFYGVHHIELLYALMGPGCERVACACDGPLEKITGYWPDGRTGTISTNHGEESPFAGTLTGGNGLVALDLSDPIHQLYGAFLRGALGFFAGGSAPVDLAETRETIAFLETAWKSRMRNGVTLELLT